MKKLLLPLFPFAVGCSSVIAPQNSFAITTKVDDDTSIVESTVSAEGVSLLSDDGIKLEYILFSEASMQAVAVCRRFRGSNANTTCAKLTSRQQSKKVIVQITCSCGAYK